MYCPEGPFLWVGPNPSAFLLYYQWSSAEIATLFENADWILGDFVPFYKIREVASILKKKIYFDPNVMLYLWKSSKIPFQGNFTNSDNIIAPIFLERDVHKYYVQTYFRFWPTYLPISILNALELEHTNSEENYVCHDWKKKYGKKKWDVVLSSWPLQLF